MKIIHQFEIECCSCLWKNKLIEVEAEYRRQGYGWWN